LRVEQVQQRTTGSSSLKAVFASTVSDEIGPLTQRVYAFVEAQKQVLAAGVSKDSDWDPLAEFVDVDNFLRVGAYLEELNWTDFKKFLAGWMAGGTRFEFTEFQISEVGDKVFQEIEERHWRGDEFIRKNVTAVYRFGPDAKLVHLDIYEQANDSGGWIVNSASAAVSGE
jgi:hypothetical protein